MKNKRITDVFCAIKDMFSVNGNVRQTFLFLDINGMLIIESYAKVLDYTRNRISFQSAKKHIYVYGKDLSVLSFTKEGMTISGTIEKIEIFEVAK